MLLEIFGLYEYVYKKKHRFHSNNFSTIIQSFYWYLFRNNCFSLSKTNHSVSLEFSDSANPLITTDLHRTTLLTSVLSLPGLEFRRIAQCHTQHHRHNNPKLSITKSMLSVENIVLYIVSETCCYKFNECSINALKFIIRPGYQLYHCLRCPCS